MGGRRIIVAALAVMLASCTPSADVTTTTVSAPLPTIAVTTTTTEAPDGFGGEVVLGSGRPVHTLNPFARSGAGAIRLVGEAVWATVFDIDLRTWERIPDTVVSLPSKTRGAVKVGEDGSMTVRYEITRGATWSDGTPISGADIAFTAEAMR